MIWGKKIHSETSVLSLLDDMGGNIKPKVPLPSEMGEVTGNVDRAMMDHSSE